MKYPFLEAKERLIRIMGTFDLATGHADTMGELLDSLESELRDVLGYYRTALKIKEDEPVAWMNDSGGCFLSDGNKYSENWIPLYTAPPKREPLSEDKLDVLAEANITDEGLAGYYLGFRDAEKAHGSGGVD